MLRCILQLKILVISAFHNGISLLHDLAFRDLKQDGRQSWFNNKMFAVHCRRSGNAALVVQALFSLCFSSLDMCVFNVLRYLRTPGLIAIKILKSQAIFAASGIQEWRLMKCLTRFCGSEYIREMESFVVCWGRRHCFAFLVRRWAAMNFISLFFL